MAEQFFDVEVFSGDVSIDDSYVILVCMTTARCGLWAFDLALNQLMQERVAEAVRAQVNGVQVSVSQLFMILAAVCAMVFSRTSSFYILVLLTLGNVLIACAMYTLWYSCSCCQKSEQDEQQHASK